MSGSDSDWDDPFAFDDSPTNYTPPRTRSQRAGGRRRPVSNVTIDLVDSEEEKKEDSAIDVTTNNRDEDKEDDDNDMIILDDFEDADEPIWQWMDDNNSWVNFSSGDIRILEEVLANRKRFKELKIGYNKYVVDLEKCTQFNVMSRRTRPVRRIPTYNRTGLRTEPSYGGRRNVTTTSNYRFTSQVPCPYFLQGYCRDGVRCRMSHGNNNNVRRRAPRVGRHTPTIQISCPYFANGFCRNGTRCPMLHNRNRNTTTTTTTTIPSYTNTPCPYFARGYCRNGSSCPQRHVRGHLTQADEMDIDNLTYDQILALEERMGNVPTKLTKPLTKRQISRLPTRKFQGKSDHLHGSTDELTCCICLCEYEQDDDLVALPCSHTFHRDCITKWLGTQKPTCPVCKAFVNTDTISKKKQNTRTPCLDFARGFCHRKNNCPFLHGNPGKANFRDDDDNDDVVIVSAPSDVSTKEDDEDPDIVMLPGPTSISTKEDGPPPPGVLTFMNDAPPGVLDLRGLSSG